MNRFDCVEYGKKTYIMGILNITPDSFSDGGKFNDMDRARKHIEEMISEGADIIDIGGESTRPGHTFVPADEEFKRIAPIIEMAKKEFSLPVSVDTYKSEVAAKALELGADMINDIWGLTYSRDMADVIASYNAHVCIMHNRENVDENIDIVRDVYEFLEKSISIALDAGISKEKIVLDPGIGFGKNFEQNLEVLKNLEVYKELGYPLLLGTSRKSFIGKILGNEASERDLATSATTAIAIADGVDIVRVHDVGTNAEVAKVIDSIYRR